MPRARRQKDVFNRRLTVTHTVWCVPRNSADDVADNAESTQRTRDSMSVYYTLVSHEQVEEFRKRAQAVKKIGRTQ